MAAYVAILWLEAASMAELPLLEAMPAVRSVIAGAHVGLAWMIGAAALLATAAVSASPLRVQSRMPATVVRILAIGVLLYSRSMVSHASAAGDFTWAVAVDWVHLVLISMWVGEVIVAGLVTLRGAPGDAPASRSDCAAYVRALSHSASIALAGLAATGVLGAWRVIERPADLFGNPYGATLMVKVGLVVGAAALGGFNRFVLMPSLLGSLTQAGRGGAHAGTRFARVLQLEALVLLAVLVTAAFLTSTSPPSAS